MNKAIRVGMMLLLILVSACGKNEVSLDESIPETVEEVASEQSNLDPETADFFYGTWEVKKLLGFANSYNDASEYPEGQKFIGDELIIDKDFFSSKGLENYEQYQYELKDPLYKITDAYEDSLSFYRLYKIEIPGFNPDDHLKVIDIIDPVKKMNIPVSIGFFVINQDRLILSSEATIFELEKKTDG